ncbi:phosphatidylinositol glycan anchor biosynthesis class U protein-like [Haliotis rufescens]|uniref:phosphatidylinositol glycan anchor biosynthesis class U protein-like n=1 Tax=Haliotis rufescens TaxID=6454 RepID=UPI001EB033F5|nr:phosphatidylinositol glycan anchor biosynthesis class U protein-like [Haliotis rufescens]
MAYQSVLCYLFGSLIRLWLFRTSFPKWLSSRNEVVTPLTSWERVQEGMALQETYISPYAGDIFHETPLLLRLLQYVAKVPQMTDILFVFMDVLIGMVLSRIAMEFGRYMLERQAQGVSRYAANVEKLVLRGSDLKWLQTYVIVVHFLNPYSIAVCLSKSTAVFTNLATLLTILNALQGNEILCSLFLALAAYQSLYPFVYIVPVALLFYKRAYPNATCYTSAEAVGSYLYTSACFLIFILLLIGVSYGLENSWDFLYSTYGFILTVPDLSPNIGVFWYFFTEMFEHFRNFFICVFQINAVVYTVPLAVKLRDSPVFQLYMLVFLTSIFKSYPSYADAALFLSLLPLWQHCFSYMRNKFVVGCMFLSCSVVAPILWHLWIYAGSANANFYFAITLTFSTAEIFLVTDLLFAFLRRQYDLNHGMDQKLDDGKPAQIVLD